MKDNDIEEDMLDAVRAYMKVMGTEDLKDFEESYSGSFGNDEDFARELAESLGETGKNFTQWPYYCIDWEYAAREIMCDYSEQDGYYFRNL